MKFTLQTAFPAQTSSESLWILVDSEQLQQNLNAYQINQLDDILECPQLKLVLMKILPLITNIAVQSNAHLLGFGKKCRIKSHKLAKLAQTIIKSSQNKFNKSRRFRALPTDLHYLLPWFNLKQPMV